MRSATKRPGTVVAVLVLTAVVMAVACSDGSPSTLRPGGPGARRLESLWWVLFGCSAVVCAIVIAGVVLVVVRRRRRGEISHRDPTRFVVLAGAVVPFVVLAAVYGLNLRDMLALTRPGEPASSGSPPLTVEVIGHQWWWEFRYPPGSSVVTANELHIPVHTDVKLILRTDDVLHSFWVPQLMPKTDLIAGQTNTMWLRADEVGDYRGQCAEYCGMQHAHMAFMVVAEPRAQFDDWLEWAGTAVRPQNPQQQRGQQVFTQMGCAACHSIRGTGADGEVAPDLTTVGDRWSLGAGTLPNDAQHMREWIDNPQQSKPGNAMPPQAVPPAAMTDLIAYLQSLRQRQEGTS